MGINGTISTMTVARVTMICALLMLSACISTKLEAPKLSIVNVGMVSADIFSQQFRIRLHVQNPNDRELPIKAIDYELFLQGDSFAEGVSDQPFIVPAKGEAEFDTVVQTNFMSSVGRLLSKLNTSDGSKVQYTFVGHVQLTKGMLRKIPFSEQGMVDLGIKR
jgi:LEA14-like dessication related protein